jgi:hypothetical protein
MVPPVRGWEVTAPPLPCAGEGGAVLDGAGFATVGVPLLAWPAGFGVALGLAGVSAGAGVLVAESFGSRILLALPRVDVLELLSVYVFAARAAEPVIRIPAIDSARAALDFMVQL